MGSNRNTGKKNAIKFDGNCNNCGKHGHKARDCWRSPSGNINGMEVERPGSVAVSNENTRSIKVTKVNPNNNNNNRRPVDTNRSPTWTPNRGGGYNKDYQRGGSNQFRRGNSSRGGNNNNTSRT